MQISLDVINKLPTGFHVLEVVETTDMDGNKREALVCVWTDHCVVRKAEFCAETGEYLGEVM
jgi:hypothetical protein